MESHRPYVRTRTNVGRTASGKITWEVSGEIVEFFPEDEVPSPDNVIRETLSITDILVDEMRKRYGPDNAKRAIEKEGSE